MAARVPRARTRIKASGMLPWAALLALGCGGSPTPHVATVELPRARGTPPRATAAGEARSTDLDALFARFQRLDAPEQESFCRERAGYTSTAFEQCDVKFVGNGSALLVSITTACGGDSCDVQGWLLTRHSEGAFVVPGAGGTVEAAPDASFVLIEEAKADAQHPVAQSVVTVRVDVPSGRTRPFAECFSPRLSPRGRYFVCRDRAANVLRVSVTGEQLELVASSGAAPEAIDWVPYAYVYPRAVEFPSPTELAYEIDYADGAVAGSTIDWHE